LTGSQSAHKIEVSTVGKHPSVSNAGEHNIKPLIGIVGGIASGKSTVAKEFAKLGCAVIDADRMVHALLEESAVRDDVVRVLGPGILDSDGRIDRRNMGQQVFADPEKLAAINGIIHPRVMDRTEKLIREYERDDRVPAIVLDVPLLIDVGWADRCDRIVYVKCDIGHRVERAGRHGVLTEQDIKIRENFQISLDDKARLADNTVDNNSELSTLVRQIKAIFSEIMKK
jgi:dephospho-CoA kinase